MGIATLARFRALEWLALPLFAPVGDEAIARLSTTSSPIRALAFGGDRVTPQALVHLGNLKTLKEITLGGRDRSFTIEAFAAAVPQDVELTFL